MRDVISYNMEKVSNDSFPGSQQQQVEIHNGWFGERHFIEQVYPLVVKSFYVAQCHPTPLLSLVFTYNHPNLRLTGCS